MASDYDRWAEIYDSVYAHVRDDIPFYVEEGRRADGAVLELGCGTGRVTLPVAEAGVDVTGLDISGAMLAVARRKMGRLGQGAVEPQLVQADMRDFSLDRRFGLVTVPFHGFQDLMSVADQVRTLGAVKRHLAPSGRLILNVFAPDPNMLTRDGDSPFLFSAVTGPESGDRLVLWQQSRYDTYNQIVDVRLIVETLDRSGTVVGRSYQDVRMRYSHRWEVHHLLNACGFEVLDLFGDFEGSPFDENSTEMVWVATPSA